MSVELCFHDTVAAQRGGHGLWQLAGVMGFSTDRPNAVLIEYADGHREWRSRDSLIATPKGRGGMQ